MPAELPTACLASALVLFVGSVLAYPHRRGIATGLFAAASLAVVAFMAAAVIGYDGR